MCLVQSVIRFPEEKNLILGTNKPYFIVLCSKIGVTAGYHGVTYFSNVRIELD